MSNEAAPIQTGRPKRSSINALASTWLARDLAARIPEYAAYVASEGVETLAGHVNEAMRGFTVGQREMDGYAARIESRTMVGAPGRTEVVLASFDKLHIDAANLLEGGWIREVALKPPFEGPYAQVRIASAIGGGTGGTEGCAFRCPDLDARGLLMVVRTGGMGYRDRPGEIVPWEKIQSAGPVDANDEPKIAARHRYLQTVATRMIESPEKSGRNETRDFAKAEFAEIAPVDRSRTLTALSQELSRTVAEGDGVALRSVLDKLAGVAAAAAVIPDPADLVDDAPEEPRRAGPRT